MPNYRTHTCINVTAAIGLAYLATNRFAAAPPLVSTGVLSFLTATFFLSPDLDLRYSNPTRNWGLLRFLWLPYQAAFKHRGLSHSLLFSSITRIAYLLCVATIVAMAANVAAHTLSSDGAFAQIPSAEDLTLVVASRYIDILSASKTYIAAAGMGVFLSDASHIVTDRVFSALKMLVKI